MSANYVIDLANTTIALPSIALGAVAGSGVAYAASGAIIGQSCDLINANAMCNLEIKGCPVFTSGQLRIQVQCSDSDTSGTYTDPTSGLQTFPTNFQSGGIVILNSGAVGGGILGAGVSGQFIQSGFSAYAGFQRPLRFARANLVSGDYYAGTLYVGFVSQQKTTGSGGGQTQSPGSGTPSI